MHGAISVSPAEIEVLRNFLVIPAERAFFFGTRNAQLTTAVMFGVAKQGL